MFYEFSSVIIIDASVHILYDDVVVGVVLQFTLYTCTIHADHAADYFCCWLVVQQIRIIFIHVCSLVDRFIVNIIICVLR